MLRETGPGLWLCDGPSVSFFGFPYPTRMAVVQLADGNLWVWSPIQLDEGWLGELDALGPVRHLVAPNKLHHLFLTSWLQRYPEAQAYAAPGLVRRRRDVPFAAELNDTPEPAWAEAIDQVVVWGSFFVDEVIFFHRAARTALVCDLIQRFPPDAVSGWKGRLMRWDGLVGSEGSTPREWRALFWNRGVARRAVQRALAWNPDQLVIAHGELPTEAGRAALERGFRWLL